MNIRAIMYCFIFVAAVCLCLVLFTCLYNGHCIVSVFIAIVALLCVMLLLLFML